MGGEGNDTLTASGEAYALGGDGNDVLFAQDNAAAQGSDGNDTLTASENGRIVGGAGNDVLIYQDIGRIASSEEGADIYVLDHAAGGAALNFEYGSRDASDQIAIHLGTSDLSNFKFFAESGTADGSDGPDGDFTEITITETLADGTTQNSSLFIRGVYGYGLRNIVLYGEEIGDVVDWKEYFGDNDTLQAAGSETVYGGAGNDIIQTSMKAVGYGGDGSDRINAFGESTVYGDASNDVIATSDNSTGYGGAGNDGVGGTFNDTVYGGSGNDDVRVSGTSEGYGDEGNDLIFARGSSEAYGGAGNDVLRLSDQATGDGGAGDDLIRINQSGAVTAGGGDDTVVSTLKGGTVTLGTGQDTLAIDVDDERGTTTLTDFDPATDELSILVPQADRAATSISLSTDATSGFVSLQITTGDTVQTLVLQGITSGVSLSSVRLFADEAALMASTSYARA